MCGFSKQTQLLQLPCIKINHFITITSQRALVKKKFLISLSILAWHTPMKSIDPDFLTIIVGKEQITAPMAPIRKFSPALIDLITHRAGPCAPITTPGCPTPFTNRSLKNLIRVICVADQTLKEDPLEGSYATLERSSLNRINPREALEVMSLGQAIGIDSRIIDALSLKIARSSKVNPILQGLLNQQNNVSCLQNKVVHQQIEALRLRIIKQYFMLHNHTMPKEAGLDFSSNRRLGMTMTDLSIHGNQVSASPTTQPVWLGGPESASTRWGVSNRYSDRINPAVVRPTRGG